MNIRLLYILEETCMENYCYYGLKLLVPLSGYVHSLL